MPPTRTCSRCAQPKPLTPDHFVFRADRQQFKTICRDCERAQQRSPAALARARARYAQKMSAVERRPYRRLDAPDRRPDPTLSPRERAIRAAAIIECEGAIVITKKFVVLVTVASTTPLLLTWLQDNYGGSISAGVVPFGHRSRWNWTVSTFNAQHLLAEILPFMLIKREQAETALALRQVQLTHSKGLSLAEKHALWQPYYDHMQTLK